MEEMAKWMEIIFDISYLIVIWVLVILMYKNRANVQEENKLTAKLFTAAFFLLALGDTGHVGFRAAAYLMGGLEANTLLVGLGSLSTAITVTFFYMIVVEIWRVHFDKKRGVFWWLMMIVSVIRLIIMALPQNRWLSQDADFIWTLSRNIPLMIVGLSVAAAIMICGVKNKDKVYIAVSSMIFTSYLFYMPVIFFAHIIPTLGMLMMPKTLAYVAVAVIAYKNLFKKKA